MEKFDSDIARAGGYSLRLMGVMPLLMAIAITIMWWIMIDRKCEEYIANNVDASILPMYFLGFVIMVFFWIGFYYLMKSITKPIWDAVEKMEKDESQNETKDTLK